MEGVVGVRGAVFNHFNNHFISLVDIRPSFDDLSFKAILNEEGSTLTNPFYAEEDKCNI